MKNQVFTLHDPCAEAKVVLSEILKCRSALQHRAVWQRLVCGHWLEVIELGRAHSVGATTARGVAHLLAEQYRRLPKYNAKYRIRKALQFIDLMYSEMESGRHLRAELEPLSKELGIGALLRENACDGSGSHSLTHTREAVPLLTKVTLTASDPSNRSSALAERALRIAGEIPPPSIDGFVGVSSIGKAPAQQRAEWLSWIDRVARSWSGPLYPRDLIRISGAPSKWVSAMYNEWRALLAEGLNDDTKRSMALSLSLEAEGIAREALALYANTDDDRAKGASLKLALDAIDRRMKILNIGSLDLSPQKASETLSLDQQAENMGLTAEDLREVADIASRAMSNNKTKS